MSVPAGSSVSVTVDAGRTYQTMAGFGSSSRLFHDPHVTETHDPAKGRPSIVIPPEGQEEILARLYTDLNLTRLRPIIWGRGILPDPAYADSRPMDAAAFDLAGLKTDDHVEFVKRAIKLGVSTVFLAPMQLEEWMTEARPEQYVEWMMVILRRWRELGVELPYHSIVNEPGYKRSGIWSGEFLRDVIKLMGPRLRAEGFATKFVVPDDLNPTEAYNRSQVILADPHARMYVGALGFHLYQDSIDNAAKMKELGDQYGLPLWMTEWSQHDPFDWSNTIHTLIADHDVSAVDYMWGYFGQWEIATDSMYLIINYDDTPAYTGYTLRKHYYVTGQFSRYVKPGSRRVEASSTDPDVRVSAFSDGGSPVVVVLNNAAVEQSVKVKLNSFSGVSAVQPVRTSASEDWAQPGALAVRDGVFTATLPAQSVTTFVATARSSSG